MAEACGKSDYLFRGIKAVVLDLDGTIYLGDRLIEGVLDLLSLFESYSVTPFFSRIIQPNRENNCLKNYWGWEYALS